MTLEISWKRTENCTLSDVPCHSEMRINFRLNSESKLLYFRKYINVVTGERVTLHHRKFGLISLPSSCFRTSRQIYITRFLDTVNTEMSYVLVMFPSLSPVSPDNCEEMALHGIHCPWKTFLISRLFLPFEQSFLDSQCKQSNWYSSPFIMTSDVQHVA